MTGDVTCSKLWRDGENILLTFCQMNTLLSYRYFENSKKKKKKGLKVKSSLITISISTLRAANPLLFTFLENDVHSLIP